MKTLIISGSPRKNGDSMTLVNEMIKYLDGEVRIIETYNNINPCVDCRYCWHNKGCSINDNMQEVYQLLNEVDNVVIASPLYFSELTGQFLSFASRLQLFYASRCIRKDSEFKQKKKNGVLVISAGGDTRDYDRSEKTANIIFNQMNTTPIGSVRSIHTNEIPAKEDIEALDKAKELALKLNELHNLSMD
ncbi:flavodoxin family protein [Clostridium estertheticum]|uniref:flavodoxin family protein n=1 Tax=Clostridium estertheticum TaxID=238834 RepID=UPI001C0D6D97|nr:flavodoxin family protein [Clostridium estertheticum]MBU3176823.1 flavodoxin family protein [Clostridium estertheticum]